MMSEAVIDAAFLHSRCPAPRRTSHTGGSWGIRTHRFRRSSVLPI